MLVKPTILQLGAGIFVRIFGFLTTAILYRLYGLEEIGEYFVILSVLTIFLSLQQIGSNKPLIKYSIENKKKYEYQILKTKIILSIISFPLFYIITSYIFDSFTSFAIAVIGFTLILNNISLDYILASKKKFLNLSVIQITSQFLLFSFFAIALVTNLKPLIVFHQVVPSFFLSFLILIVAIPIANLNLKKIFSSSLVSSNYFTRNKILILTVIFLSLISSVDYFLAKRVLLGDDLGLMTGLYRYSLLSFGFLTIINKILFTYALNTSSSKRFKHSRELLISRYKIVSFLGLTILLYPYLKYVMALSEISKLIYPGLIVVSTLLLMPKFFLEINKIESNEKKVSFVLFSGFASFVLILYYSGSIYCTSIFSQLNLLLFLSIVFVIKWLILTIGLVYIRKKCNII